MLENYGSTIDLTNSLNLRRGNDADVAALINEINGGEVQALLVYNANPVYTLPNGKQFGEALKKIPLTVSFADRMDETASACKYVCPDHHPLESWNDAEPKKGIFSFSQPTINPLFATRQMQESLLVWSGNVMNYHDYLVQQWKGKADDIPIRPVAFCALEHNVERHHRFALSLEPFLFRFCYRLVTVKKISNHRFGETRRHFKRLVDLAVLHVRLVPLFCLRRMEEKAPLLRGAHHIP
jgi:hypothetical protein